MGDAQAQLLAQQMQAALQNQATGVNSAQGAGNVAQQGINNLLTTGQYQQASPFANVSNYGKVIGGIQAPTTVKNQTQLSPLNQIMGVATALGGSTGSGGLYGTMFGGKPLLDSAGKPILDASGKPVMSSGLLNNLYNKATGLFSSDQGTGAPTQAGGTSYNLQGGGQLIMNPDGSQSITDASGNVTLYDAGGNPVGSYNQSDFSGGTGGGDTGTLPDYGNMVDNTTNDIPVMEPSVDPSTLDQLF